MDLRKLNWSHLHLYMLRYINKFDSDMITSKTSDITCTYIVNWSILVLRDKDLEFIFGDIRQKINHKITLLHSLKNYIFDSQVRHSVLLTDQITNQTHLQRMHFLNMIWVLIPF